MASMQGKRVLITGANSGIGKMAAIALAQQGAEIVMGCRNLSSAEAAKGEIQQQAPGAEVHVMALDLASLQSIHQFAEQCNKQFDRLDVLINNAGLASIERQETQDGFELTMGTNHLGPFLLTHLLLPLLQKAEHARIINVASHSHYSGKIDFDDFHSKHNYRVMKVYGASKLANVLFTQELAERLRDQGITVNALHPGMVATNIWPDDKLWQRAASWVAKQFMISEKKGAETTVYLASSDKVAQTSGKYFYKKKPVRPAKACNDKAVQQRLWDLSETLTGLNQEPELLIARPS